jgi:hypothetical protein
VAVEVLCSASSGARRSSDGLPPPPTLLTGVEGEDGEGTWRLDGGRWWRRLLGVCPANGQKLR